MLTRFVDLGGRVIDSSPMYGRAEAVVGDLLAAMDGHDKAFVATKVWTSGERAGIGQMEASLAKLTKKKRPDKVLMLIITDGQENSSKELQESSQSAPLPGAEKS